MPEPAYSHVCPELLTILGLCNQTCLVGSCDKFAINAPVVVPNTVNVPVYKSFRTAVSVTAMLHATPLLVTIVLPVENGFLITLAFTVT